MTHISHAFFICFFTQPDILFLLSDWGSAQSRCSHWTVMSFRSYSQEAPTNSEPFSLDEAFNLFPPESFTLSLAVLDFSHHYVHQWLGFVHSIEGTFPSSLVLNKLITPWHQHIHPSTTQSCLIVLVKGIELYFPSWLSLWFWWVAEKECENKSWDLFCRFYSSFSATHHSHVTILSCFVSDHEDLRSHAYFLGSEFP